MLFRRRQRSQVPSSLAGAAKITVDGLGMTDGATTERTSAHVTAQRRSRRSKELLSSIEQLDAHADTEAQRQLMEWIQRQYDERGGGELIGLFARCYLGEPYVDHHLAISHQILQHFTADDAVPAAFASARPLVRSPAYLFVEVYADGTAIPVRADGEPIL